MLKKLLYVIAAAVLLPALWFAYTVSAFYLYWSPSDPVQINSGGITLSGTLVKPADEGVFPAAIILHGAGPGTRNGPGYRAHARALINAGFAVLLYDKRGSGDSSGDFASATYDDFIADAKAAIAHLAVRDDIDADRIGLVGASESGWFTPQIAAQENIAFVINKAGPPLDWLTTVKWEVRNDLQDRGLSAAEVARQLDLIDRTWRLMIRVGAARDAGTASPELDALIAEIRASLPDADAIYEHTMTAYDTGRIAPYADRLAYDPRPWLDRAEVPMLYVFAEHDINVPSAASAAYLENLRRAKSKDISTLTLPDVGHTFYSWTGLLSGGYPPGYMDAIAEWAQLAATAGNDRTEPDV